MTTELEKEITVDELRKHFEDPKWRINNLYYIKNKEGKKVLFKMNAVQEFIYDNLWYFNIIPKARQLGVTTFFAIMYFDQVLFGKNITAGIIAHRQEDMKKIFKHKIRFAWDNLHPWLKAKIGEPDIDSAHEMSFKNGSTIFVTMTTRSGTVQFLHISEFGYICQKYPEKADEIVTGAINSVEIGQMVSIESTAAGQEGNFYDFCMDAERERKEGKDLTPLDFKIFFFAWFLDPNYRLEADITFTKEQLDYFNELEMKDGIKLDTEQKNWYVKKKKTQKNKMFSEYPSTLAEAFRTSVEGSYYKAEMELVYTQNRITIVPHDPMVEVETFWDLGMNDYNVALLVQSKGDQIRFIDMYWNRGEKLAHYYNWLQEQREKFGYRYGRHFFPHDIEVKELGTGISRREVLYKLGMRNIITGKKMGVNEGIDKVRTLFPRFRFDEERCQKLYESLFNYKQDFDKKLGVFKDKPKHDENSHFADPVRLLAQEYREKINMRDYDGNKVETEQAFFG